LIQDMLTRAHIIAVGLVQGVGYRWFAARRARELGLSGFVRNLREGTVEVEAEGERALVEELVNQLRIGPRAARVTDLRIDWRQPSPARSSTPHEFEIR
jgi:acylphosphatase